jgi:hypothetical protein
MMRYRKRSTVKKESDPGPDKRSLRTPDRWDLHTCMVRPKSSPWRSILPHSRLRNRRFRDGLLRIIETVGRAPPCLLNKHGELIFTSMGVTIIRVTGYRKDAHAPES